MKVYENITLSKSAEDFFGGLGLTERQMARALGEVLGEARGPGGVFASHFRQGQGEWPELSEGWKNDKRKGDSRKFYQSGRVYRAITQPGLAGQVLQYGSSADAVSGGEVDVRYVSGGMWVQVKAVARKATIKVGFVGRYKKSSRWTKLQTAYAGNLGTGSREEIKAANRQRKQLARMLNIRRQEAVGAKGFRRVKGADGKKKTQWLLARGSENFAYANVLQRGQFKGVNTTDGRMLSPRQAGRLRKTAGGKIALKGGKGIFGTARPLLPAKSGDTLRFARALERGVDAAMKAAGW